MGRIKGYRFIIAIGLMLLITYGCRKNEVENTTAVNSYYSYFPIRLGSTYIYKVDSLTYNYFRHAYDSSTNYLKEVIDSPFTDNMGDKAYKVSRYWTQDTINIPWSMERVWTEKRTLRTAERWEENTRLVKLSFPIAPGRSWNGNSYNNGYYSTVGLDSFKSFNCSYGDVHTPFKLAGKNYDSTALVNIIDYSDFLHHFKASERYAAKVGLIYKEIMDTASNLQHTIQGSYFYKQTLIQYR
jgi:hypothetical protein